MYSMGTSDEGSGDEFAYSKGAKKTPGGRLAKKMKPASPKKTIEISSEDEMEYVAVGQKGRARSAAASKTKKYVEIESGDDGESGGSMFVDE